MKTNSFKILFCVLLCSSSILGQALLPFSYDYGKPISVDGLSSVGLATDYTSSPKIKFDSTNDEMILSFSSTPGILSFAIKWTNSVSSTDQSFNGQFAVYESADGVTYTLLKEYSSSSQLLSHNTVLFDEITTIQPESRYIKWMYKLKNTGNIGIGKLSLTADNIHCSSSNLHFDNMELNKLNTDLPFTIVPKSLNLASSVLYSSTNTNVAIVNHSTGEVQLLAPGTTTIKALQQEGNFENVSYCQSQVEYVLNVISNTPELRFSEVGPILCKTALGKSIQSVLHLSGDRLVNNVNLSIEGDNFEYFSLSSTSFMAESGLLPLSDVFITYTPTSIGEHTALLRVKSDGAQDLLISLTGNAFSLQGNGSIETPYSVEDVKSLNNTLSSTSKYWVEGYVVGVPSGGNGVDLTTVDLEYPFSSNTSIALASMSNETDLSKMIGVQLPLGDIRVALNLMDNQNVLNQKIKVLGTLEGYYSLTPGVKNTSEYLFLSNATGEIGVKSIAYYTHENQIVVFVNELIEVELFNLYGHKLLHTNLVKGENVIPMKEKGVYILKVDSSLYKIIL